MRHVQMGFENGLQQKSSNEIFLSDFSKNEGEREKGLVRVYE